LDLTQLGGTTEELDDLLSSQRLEVKATKRQSKDTKVGLPRHAQGEKFVKGPVPLSWLRLALSLGGKAGNLAWALWWRAGVEGGSPVPITPKMLADFDLPERTTSRLLHHFESAGLIKVDRQRGRCPRVGLLDVSPSAPAVEQVIQ
jgi:hypothetical protein